MQHFSNINLREVNISYLSSDIKIKDYKVETSFVISEEPNSLTNKTFINLYFINQVKLIRYNIIRYMNFQYSSEKIVCSLIYSVVGYSKLLMELHF